MTIKKSSRQRFLNAMRFNDISSRLERSTRSYQNELDKGGLTPKSEMRFRWLLALRGLEFLILKFTNGETIETIRDSVPDVIQNFDVFARTEASYRLSSNAQFEASTLEITQLEAYVSIIWLLSICKLTHQETYIPIVISWLDSDAEFNRGRDILLENLINALTKKSVPSENAILHSKPYLPLGCATVYPAEKRIELIKQFLDEWYKGMKPCYWYGTHTDKQGSSYFGYWAFEAALVTVLWDIDDTEYRNHLVYPQDLVDWYRANTTTSSNEGPQSCQAGLPCPRTGWWFTPAKTNSRAFFNDGDILPSFQGSDYGTVIWQWDADQSKPAL